MSARSDQIADEFRVVLVPAGALLDLFRRQIGLGGWPDCRYTSTMANFG